MKTPNPLRLLDLFKYYKGRPHQTAALGLLEASILQVSPGLLQRDSEWYQTWLYGVLDKPRKWHVTREQISQISGFDEDKFDDDFMNDLNRLLEGTGMLSLNQRRMLIAQMCHESGGFRWMTELGTREYFTRMYDGRSDLGNGPGDGYKYRGCGPIQLTGKYNFERFAKWMESNGMKDDRIMEGTDYVISKYPFLCCACWIEENDYARICERGDIYEATRRLNGGYNGINSRIDYYEQAKQCINE